MSHLTFELFTNDVNNGILFQLVVNGNQVSVAMQRLTT